MKYIILTAPTGYRDTVTAVLENHEVAPIWWETSADHDESFSVRFLSGVADEQKLLDELEKVVGGAETAGIHTLRVDSAFPRRLPFAPAPKLTRDELRLIAEQGSASDPLYLLLVALSTIVATIGLLQNNIAVVIGAMVIAPLLGPNLSAALGVALGEFKLARRATGTFVVGVLLAFSLSVLIGLIWPLREAGAELMSRTVIGIDSPLLALASGAAGVLSLTSGVPGVLVGVMVAVALLPPLASCGILLGWGQWQLALSALILFVINVAAINLSAHVTLFLSAIAPRTRALATLARRNSLVSSAIWFAVIVALTWLSVR